MKTLIHILFKVSVILCILYSFPALAQESTTYYLIRHAEKNLSDKTNRDPHLTEVGQKRAETWKVIFKEVAFDKIYATAYHRTRETVMPTAKSQNLTLDYYDPRALYSETFKADTKGKIVLVVGHSNTTPQLANAILGKKIYPNLDESIHGNLYLIQKIGDTVNCQLLSLE